jgi:excisionase family DNA binding protein
MNESLRIEARLLSSRQAATYLALSERTIWTLVKDGRLKAVKIGRCVRFDVEDLDAFITAAKVGHTAADGGN